MKMSEERTGRRQNFKDMVTEEVSVVKRKVK